MTLHLAFWAIMLVWLIIGAVMATRPPAPPPGWVPALPGGILLFLLVVVFGWAQFGAPFK